MLDLVIRNARICEGTGRPSYIGSLGVEAGRIVRVGQEDGLAARRTIDAEGLALAPGFIDPHTHYDAQVAWDPLLTCSPWHGVTTVVMGNCGVGVAPVKPETRDVLLYDLVNVEAIPYDVIFLDINMPGLTGVQLAEALGTHPRPPAIIFVTAHSEHAVKAFEVKATDYLVKPVELDRLKQAISRLTPSCSASSVVSFG